MSETNPKLNFTHESCSDTGCITFYVNGEEITDWYQETDAEDCQNEFKRIYMAGYSKALAQKEAEIAELEEKLKAQEECQERNDASNQDLLHEQDLELKKVRQENTKILGWIGQAMMRGLNEIDCGDELIKFQETNNLEQQAKGVEDIMEALFTISHINTTAYDKGFDIAKKLRQQAKALENGDKPQGGE